MAKSSSRGSAKTTTKRRGTVTSIARDWDDPKKVRIEVELPKPKSKGKKGELSYNPSQSVVVDKAFARNVVIGAKLDIDTSVAKR